MAGGLGLRDWNTESSHGMWAGFERLEHRNSPGRWAGLRDRNAENSPGSWAGFERLEDRKQSWKVGWV